MRIAICGGNFDNGVIVIRHQAIRLAVQTVSLRRFAKPFYESPSIGIILKDDALPITPRHHVVSRTLELDPLSPCHGR